MNQGQRRAYLLHFLLEEAPQYHDIEIPSEEAEQRNLLRSLLNIRPPRPISTDFLAVQDAYLQEESTLRGITDAAAFPPVPGHSSLSIWRGDITALKVDGIVNAANSGMLGCFVPCHDCIDNVIHTNAGVQLRLACDALMERQGCEEATGTAKLTEAYNLPCRYVLHTVGPIVSGRLTARHEEQLASCYRSCLALAAEHSLTSIAFCCISTGEFHFPQERAAEIAVQTVIDYLREQPAQMKVIFNVFKESDHAIYNQLLGIGS